MATFHPEILSEVQRTALEGTVALTDGLGFYLGGGTAVALRLGHRRSEDFDWFRPESLGDPFVLAARLRETAAGFDVTGMDRGTLHGVTSGVRISLLEYPYPLLSPAERWLEGGCRVASLEDLACMKLAAVAQRGSRRDFVDIHGVIEAGLTMEEMFDAYRRKYSTKEIGHVLRGLVYFDDAEGEPMPRMLHEVDWEGLKQDLIQRVRRHAGRNPS
jgi:hypothetical protein